LDVNILPVQCIKGKASNLKVLTLKNNSIGPIGLAALAQALETSACLEELQVFGNEFNNDNGMQFHALLQHRLPYFNMRVDVRVYVVDGTYMVAES
jgi:hypothetical protein